MPATLVVLTGPLKGQFIALSADDMSIGRDESNGLAVGDLALSRKHCLIEAVNDGFRVRDLDSLNGTFVNGVPIRERTLAHGDEVRVGDSIFLFLRPNEPDAAPSTSVEFHDDPERATSPVVLPLENARYLRTPATPRDSPSGQVARDLEALLHISAAIHVIRNRDALQQRLLELTLEIVPAEFGAILLAGEGGKDFDRVVTSHRGPDRTVTISRTIARRAIVEGVALLCNDVPGSEEFRAARSAVASRTHAVLCAPLSVFGRTLGALYLSDTSPSAAFDSHHLELVTGIAAIAAVALENARHLDWLQSEARRLQADLEIEHTMVGEAACMREVYQFVSKVAPRDSTVLISGESGTGKELVARAIHANSARAQNAFVPINCAALVETLLESELFGHEKGAFTGAIAQKRGKLEVADRGTVFLDEVGELAPPLQVKLLRVLQEREFERVGGTRPIKVDIRFIAATNCDLAQAVKDGCFRQDLYYRLNVVSLTVPPLRDRREDIPLLASYFVRKYSVSCHRQVAGISAEARACLLVYDWPGNVRELENAIERAIVMGSSDRILPQDLPEAVIERATAESTGSPERGVGEYHALVSEAKRQAIMAAVERASGNYAQAARLLGLQPTYLHRLIRNLSLKERLKR